MALLEYPMRLARIKGGPLCGPQARLREAQGCLHTGVQAPGVVHEVERSGPPGIAAFKTLFIFIKNYWVKNHIV